MTGLLNSPWGLARKCPRRSAGCSGSRSYPVAERTARILVHCAIGRLPADGSDQLHRRPFLALENLIARLKSGDLAPESYPVSLDSLQDIAKSEKFV